MAKIESKTWKIVQSDLEIEIAKHEHFGWEFVSNSVNEGGLFITLTMKRNRRDSHYRRYKRLEFQARIIGRNFPVSFIVWTIVGLAFLIPWFFFMNNPYLIFLLSNALFCFTVALFILLIYLFTRHKKKILLKELYDEGDEMRGKLKVNPTPENTLQPGKETYHLRQYIYSLGKQKNLSDDSSST